MSQKEKKYEIPHAVKLQFPVTFGKEEITEIVIPRRIKAKDLKDIPDTMPSVNSTIKIASRVTGKFQAVFEELDAIDFAEVAEAIKHFLPNTPETGDDA